ncbi:hypothetical protein, unlikely [Trypanosoma brucei gambiense DAL972]|uniref:Uncharacterized protein n=1 Tax=Trypanosoma brucei gambiense (strain MHOM/CI/86/DAL972) TaxID=679716 RepID=D0A0M7_TRYB9|nr:hypothetical protein, unlikely [Trypanosoma brucei gambiense DAL972]CBH16785.1 hypothetical protein, unlikely [Trypanosoma brucei gambiense DAL972]|eukprot:XP_011779049.1 hypothetical protein, unlikely [Trypanosoma brucei gambiense DAL972]
MELNNVIFWVCALYNEMLAMVAFFIYYFLPPFTCSSQRCLCIRVLLHKHLPSFGHLFLSFVWVWVCIAALFIPVERAFLISPLISHLMVAWFLLCVPTRRGEKRKGKEEGAKPQQISG